MGLGNSLKNFALGTAQTFAAGGPQAQQEAQLKQDKLQQNVQAQQFKQGVALRQFSAKQDAAELNRLNILSQIGKRDFDLQTAQSEQTRRLLQANQIAPEAGPPQIDFGLGGQLTRNLLLSGNDSGLGSLIDARNKPQRLGSGDSLYDRQGNLLATAPAAPRTGGRPERRLARSDLRKRLGVLLGAAPELSESGNGFASATQETVDALAVAATPIAQRLVSQGVQEYDALLIAVEQVLGDNLTEAEDGGFFGSPVAPAFRRSVPTRKPAGGDLARARAAIAKGAPREAVIQRLIEAGIDPAEL